MRDTSLDVEVLAAALAPLLAERLHRDAEALLDLPQLAERVQMSERGVRGLVARGELPGPLLHTGGVARWSWPAVLKYLEGRQGRRVRRGRGKYSRGRAGERPAPVRPAAARESDAPRGVPGSTPGS